jgi:pyridoxine kinase
MRDQVVPKADLLTPNQFELEFLTGRTVSSNAELLDAVDAVREMGPQTVLVTSVQTPQTPDDEIEMVAVSAEGAWSVRTPLLPLTVNGAGDATAALFLAHTLEAGPQTALERTASSVFAVLKATVAGGHGEIQLIAAQDTIANPPGEFAATRLR